MDILKDYGDWIKAAKKAGGWHDKVFLETAFMPTTTLEGEGPVVSVPEHDFAFVHGWADMALCKLPIPRDGKKPRRVSGEQNVLVNGYLLINKQQIQALKARQILSDSTKAKTYALVFNRPVPKNFSMPEFIQQQATEEAQVLADLRPFL